jgi:hypothetical protein
MGYFFWGIGIPKASNRPVFNFLLRMLKNTEQKYLFINCYK